MARLLKVKNKSILLNSLILIAVGVTVPVAGFSMSSTSGASSSSVLIACEVTGCNGELCTEKGSVSELVMSICMFDDKFSCYKDFGTCEADSNGECNWRENTALTHCLDEKSGVQHFIH